MRAGITEHHSPLSTMANAPEKQWHSNNSNDNTPTPTAARKETMAAKQGTPPLSGHDFKGFNRTWHGLLYKQFGIQMAAPTRHSSPPISVRV